jgi:phosphohistidine phosphatase SixA
MSTGITKQPVGGVHTGAKRNQPGGNGATSAPRTILLFRHAEKPTDPADPNLSAAGHERAERLADYIPKTFGRPDFIFATAFSQHSQRPYETVQPLSEATGRPIDATIKNADFQVLAQALFGDAQYAGKLVVLCWHHGTMPDLAAALNAPQGTYPETWDAGVFDLILKLDYQPGDHTPSVTQVTEPF